MYLGLIQPPLTSHNQEGLLSDMSISTNYVHRSFTSKLTIKMTDSESALKVLLESLSDATSEYCFHMMCYSCVDILRALFEYLCRKLQRPLKSNSHILDRESSGTFDECPTVACPIEQIFDCIEESIEKHWVLLSISADAKIREDFRLELMEIMESLRGRLDFMDGQVT